MKMLLLQSNNKKGSSLLEILVALAIFAFIASSLTSLSVGGGQGLVQGGELSVAEGLAQEGIEAVRSIRDRAWNELILSETGVSTSSDEWFFDGEGTQNTEGIFTRKISLSQVCRDFGGHITDCPGAYTDPHTKFASSSVYWNALSGSLNVVSRASYLSNWNSLEWIQTDWSGGPGQDRWGNESKYDEDDSNIDFSTIGEAKLLPSNSSQLVLDPDFEASPENTYSWPFDIPGNYIYDDSDIEVTGSNAQLIASGGSLVMGSTVNSDFDSGENNWVYFDWDEGGADPDATGGHLFSGGNPDGYVDIDLPLNLRNRELGGFWEQSFVVSENNPVASCEIDWKSFSANLPPQGVDSLFVAVYLDDFSGEPIIGSEILSKNFVDIFDWESHSGANAFDCSSNIGASGTYYYKIAVWIDAVNRNTGPINVGFDNAKVAWVKSVGGSYPTNEPAITPASPLVEEGVLAWTSFIETASKDGGEIYYQLSDDGGTFWKYWDGSNWSNALAEGDYNNAIVVDSNIGSFPTSNEQITFRAFLSSDGSDFVQLDEVEIGYKPVSSVWNYFTWSVGGGEVTPTGSRHVSGGNPNGYVDIDIPSNARNDTVGGFWEQSVFVTEDNANLICQFDWSVPEYSAPDGVDDSRAYVFLDTSSGEPVIGNQIWSSAPITGASSWSQEAFDCSGAAPNSGTYYLKIAHWLDANNRETGPIVVGYDNVQINSSASGYETSGSLISSAFDMGDASPVQVIGWDEDLSACSPLCSIRFQLQSAPDSGGSPGAWTDWYGASGAGTYFVSATGTVVSTDLNGNEWVRYRGELLGDGTATPVLKEIRVNYK